MQNNDFQSGGYSTNASITINTGRAYCIYYPIKKGSYCSFDADKWEINHYYVNSPEDLTFIYSPNKWDGSGLLQFDYMDDACIIVVVRDINNKSIVNRMEEINRSVFLFNDVNTHFLNKIQSLRLATFDTEIVVQSFAIVNEYAYVYSSTTPPCIVKYNFRTKAETIHNITLGHGNGMCYYNGFLYVASMENSGEIYKVSIDELETVAETYILHVDETTIEPLSITFDYAVNQFIVKTRTDFVFCDTEMNVIRRVGIKYQKDNIGQQLSCDGDYIYVTASTSNQINVYDYNGNYIISVAIVVESEYDECEGIYNDGMGGWYSLTYIRGHRGWFIDAIQFYKNITINNIAAIVKCLQY